MSFIHILQFTVKYTPDLEQFLRNYMEYVIEVYTHVPVMWRECFLCSNSSVKRLCLNTRAKGICGIPLAEWGNNT